MKKNQTLVEKKIEKSNFFKSINSKYLTFKNEILRMNSTLDDKSLIFGSSIGDLVFLNLETGKFFKKENQLCKKSIWIRSITKDIFGRYWVGSTAQLSVYDRNFRFLMNFQVEEEVNFYGNFETFFISCEKRRGYWWVSKTKICVFDVKLMKIIYSISGLVTGIFFQIFFKKKIIFLIFFRK